MAAGDEIIGSTLGSQIVTVLWPQHASELEAKIDELIDGKIVAEENAEHAAELCDKAVLEAEQWRAQAEVILSVSPAALLNRHCAGGG